ncbi:MAG: hypothetical protein HOF43_11730 [Chloroflexi bacterium]|nr:hypothetical protein [Chloroflexota bacterium]
MIKRINQSFKSPTTSQRYKTAALFIGTAAAVAIGVANALSPPELGSEYEKDNAFGVFLVVAQTLPLILAFRYPLVGLSLIMGSFMVHSGLGFDAPWIVQFTAAITFFTSVTRGGDRQSLLALLVVYGAVIVSFGFFRENDRFGNVLAQIILFGGLWIIGNLFRTGRIRLESTERVVVELEVEQDRLALQAVQDERARIARELHDVLGHTLNLVVIQAGAAQRVFDASPDKALEAVKSIESTSRQALSDVDRMLGILRDPDDLSHASLEARPSMSRIDSLVADLRATGQSIDLVISGTPGKLAPSVDLSAFRVVQEALTNVVTHAAGAEARVEVEYAENLLSVTISDDGSGVDQSVEGKGGGRGLVGMRERTALFGGEFQAGRTDDDRWRVHATFPINAGRPEEGLR